MNVVRGEDPVHCESAIGDILHQQRNIPFELAQKVPCALDGENPGSGARSTVLTSGHRSKPFSGKPSNSAKRCAAVPSDSRELRHERGSPITFRNLRNRRPATPSRGLDLRPRRARPNHGGDPGVPGNVLLPAAIPAFGLGPRLTLSLTTTPILVVLPGHCSENVEHHPVDRVEHASG